MPFLRLSGEKNAAACTKKPKIILTDMCTCGSKVNFHHVGKIPKGCWEIWRPWQGGLPSTLNPRQKRRFSLSCDCSVTIHRTAQDYIHVVMPGDDVQEARGSLTGPAGGSIQQLLQWICPFQFRLLLDSWLLEGYFAGRRRVVLHQLFGQDVGHCVARSPVIGWGRQIKNLSKIKQAKVTLWR